MTVKELWKKYKETNENEYKQKLIEHYISLVKIVAGRMYNFYGSKIEFEDLIGYGVLGLIDGIEKFDINKNIKFETYAQIRIRGAIIDSIRKIDWIPRSLRKKSKYMQKSILKFENEIGRSPTDTELADYLNIDVEEVKSILSNISTFNVISLEEFLNIKNECNFEVNYNKDTPENIYEINEIKKILAEKIDNLPQKEKLVISLYYYEELTYKEIGHIMNLSESRISQIHSKAILKIKNGLLKENIE